MVRTVMFLFKDFTLFNWIYLFTIYIFFYFIYTISYYLFYIYLLYIFIIILRFFVSCFFIYLLLIGARKESLWYIRFKCIPGCRELTRYLSTHTHFLTPQYILVMSFGMTGMVNFCYGLYSLSLIFGMLVE